MSLKYRLQLDYPTFRKLEIISEKDGIVTYRDERGSVFLQRKDKINEVWFDNKSEMIMKARMLKRFEIVEVEKRLEKLKEDLENIKSW